MFLCVNVALGIGNYNKNIRAYKLSDKRKENIVSVLKKNNITIQTKLPIHFEPIPSLWVLPVEVSPNVRDYLIKSLIGNLEDGVQITKEKSEVPYEKDTRVYTKGKKELRFRTNYVHYEDQGVQASSGFLTENKAKTLADNFLEEAKLTKKIKKLKMEYRNESYGASITYYEVYDKLPIFGSYIHMKISEEGVFEVVLHGNTVEDKAGIKQIIEPIDTVLFGLIDQLDTSEPVIIEDITLGYAIPGEVEMHVLREEAIPMYKISIQGLEEPIFVNAYTNTVGELPTGTFYK